MAGAAFAVAVCDPQYAFHESDAGRKDRQPLDAIAYGGQFGAPISLAE